MTEDQIVLVFACMRVRKEEDFLCYRCKRVFVQETNTKNHVKDCKGQLDHWKIECSVYKKNLSSPTLLGISGGNWEVMAQPKARVYRANIHKRSLGFKTS